MNDYAYSEPDFPPADDADEPYFPLMDYADEVFYMPQPPYEDVYLDTLPNDPFPPPVYDDWLPDDVAPTFAVDPDDYPGPEQDGLQSQDQQFVDEAWRWQDTRLVGVERDRPVRPLRDRRNGCVRPCRDRRSRGAVSAPHAICRFCCKCGGTSISSPFKVWLLECGHWRN